MSQSKLALTPETSLYGMLGMCRPAGSKSERRFIRDWLAPLGIEQDAAGNVIKQIGDAPILWSSHTDSVHRRGGTQALQLVDRPSGLTIEHQRGANKHYINCLGADDCAGVWLMREMILAEKPGLYIFHRGEECGGIGSSFIADYCPEVLSGIRAAIAFDRKGTNDIITHQGLRCCSDEFAESLAQHLGMKHRPDDGGTFTDTANYTDHIGECTNVSVGFNMEHSSLETLNVDYLLDLRKAVLALDTDKLTFKRAPGEYEPRSFFGLGFLGEWGGKPESAKDKATRAVRSTARDGDGDLYDWPEDGWQCQVDDIAPQKTEIDELAALIKNNPEIVAEMFIDEGLTVDELRQEIAYRAGYFYE